MPEKPHPPVFRVRLRGPKEQMRLLLVEQALEPQGVVIEGDTVEMDVFLPEPQLVLLEKFGLKALRSLNATEFLRELLDKLRGSPKGESLLPGIGTLVDK